MWKLVLRLDTRGAFPICHIKIDSEVKYLKYLVLRVKFVVEPPIWVENPTHSTNINMNIFSFRANKTSNIFSFINWQIYCEKENENEFRQSQFM